MPEEVQLTPKQQAQYDQMAASAPAESPLPVEINPIRDFDANQLAELAVKDKEGFDLVGEFRRNQDLWSNPAIVQKAADALNLVKQRGFELSDLPGPKKIGQTVLESAKGFGKQLWNYGSAAVGMIQGALAEPFSSDLATGFAEGVTQKLAKNIAGTEEAMTGLSQLPGKAVRKIGQVTGLAKDFNQFSPEEKLSDLWKDVGVSEVQQQRVTGQGAFTQAVTGGVAGELPAEEVSTLAAGDPFSFAAFSKGFQLAGRAVPGVVRGALAKTGEKVGEVAAAVGGRTVQTAGKVTELGARSAQAIAPAAGLVKGAIEAGPVGALAGLKAGEIAASVAKKVAGAGKAVAEVGKQLAGAAPVTSALSQAGRDVLESVPGAVGTTAIGLGQDIGLSALTSETPAETQGAIGIGTALGAAGAAGRIGRRVISGQLVAPREYGVNTVTPSSGNFPALDRVHSESIRQAAPGEQTRLNAVRLFAKGAAPGTDIFFARDPATLTQTLTGLGIAPDTAAQFAQQEGFFTQNLPDKNGNVRPVIIVRNLDAAPHEAFHAVQDVLGESANRELDNVVRQEYADRWETEGQRYANRLVGNLEGRDWRETILDESGWGHAEAMEKLSNAVANEVIGQTGAEPQPGFVADRVRADWRRIFEAARSRNPAARPEQVWREILSPEESAAVADRYIARELAAENFDIIFKNLGAALDTKQPLVRKLAGVAAKLISTLGGQPLAGRRSDIGQIEPRFSVTEAVTGVARGQRPAPIVEPKAPLQPVSVPRTPEESQDAASAARQIAEQASTDIQAGGTSSPREMLGAIAEAIAQRAGIKINYLSAPGEPAAATTSNRTIRREIIEAFRTMPAAARALWEKNFFPERVLRTKGGKYQVLGWAPEVFAANAHKLAGWLSEHTSVASPYAIDTATKTFTPDAWQQLFADTQQFVRNQQAGATGAGGELVVPRSVTERGFTAPARTGGESPLAQGKADVINMLFGFKLPETPRMQKGKLPLAIAGEEVSAATQPGRVEPPVRARGEFTGAEAEAQGIAGRPVQEVNPFRNSVEAAGNPPSLIEAVQRLNLENIKEVALSTEQPDFRGNTLTLTAGFQPRTESGKELVKKGFDFRTTGILGNRSFIVSSGGRNVGQLLTKQTDPRTASIDSVFVNKDFQNQGIGEVLYREAGEQLKIDGVETIVGNIVNPAAARLRERVFPSTEFIEEGMAASGEPALDATSRITSESQFQPSQTRSEIDRLKSFSPDEFRSFMGSYKSDKFGGNLTGWAFDVGSQARTVEDVAALREAAELFSSLGREAMAAKDMNAAFGFINRSQAAKEAYQAATGQNLAGEPASISFIRENYDPNYIPPVPPVRSREEQVRDVLTAHKAGGGSTFNLSQNKNLSGEPFFAVSIHPERSKIIDGQPTESDISGYVEANQDLLSQTENSLGTWSNEGKTYLDVVATVPDRESAIQLGKDNNQIAIFDLKNFVEIPTGGTGEAPVQFQPAKQRTQLKFPKTSSGGFKKAWVLPNGEPVQLGGTWHHEWLADNPAIAKKYKLDVPKFTGNDTEQVREDALRAGFARINYSVNNGTLTVEARAKDWRKVKNAVEDMVSTNLDDIDNIRVSLFDDAVKEVVDSDSSALFNLDSDQDKLAAIPFITKGEVRGQTQFQSAREAKETLFDLPEPASFPEAVIPKRGQTDIPSDIVGSPLFKQAETREAAISLFSDKLIEEAQRREGNPAFQLGKRWYSEFTPLLKKEFGSDAPLMAELLAATSPQTNVETNFGYAIDVLNNWKAGKFDKLISKLNEGYKRLEDGSLAKIYRRDVREGRVTDPPETPSDATYMAWWILKHDLLPRGTSGQQVGLHSKNVAKVLTRRWLSETKGPKTKNFVQNLIGAGDEATIDIWADRLLRRIGYEGLVEKWRIKPEHAKGVSDADFEFGQQVFRAAADQLGMKPSDLQAALWFTEKQRWADNKWSEKLDLGDFRTEIRRTAEYRRGFAEGKGPAEVRRGARQAEPEYEQPTLDIQPARRRVR